VSSAANTVFTIGHSSRSFAEILAILKAWQVQIVLDIRSRPHINFFPEFSRRRMKMRLVNEEIVYVFMGDLLGHAPKGDFRTCLGDIDFMKMETSPEFQKGISWILEEQRHSRICLFCGEADPYVCHRHHLVAQHLLTRGVRVRHILPTGRIEEAQPDLFHRPMA
jgi:uncharacterized protein (DUF488 family)